MLLAYSAPVDGRCLCALALTGGTATWTEEVRSAAHAIAALMASQVRHAAILSGWPNGRRCTPP